LEVLLATSMLIGSAIVLVELATIGNRHAASARDLARSQLICQTKLNAIVLGLAPAESVRETPLEDDPHWVYWIDVLPAPQSGLLVAKVGAARQAGQKQSARFTLTRWVRGGAGPSVDPQTPATTDSVAQGASLP
jgi:hypothetical protein